MGNCNLTSLYAPRLGKVGQIQLSATLANSHTEAIVGEDTAQQCDYCKCGCIVQGYFRYVLVHCAQCNSATRRCGKPTYGPPEQFNKTKISTGTLHIVKNLNQTVLADFSATLLLSLVMMNSVGTGSETPDSPVSAHLAPPNGR